MNFNGSVLFDTALVTVACVWNDIVGADVLDIKIILFCSLFFSKQQIVRRRQILVIVEYFL